MLYVTGGKQRRSSNGIDEWQAYERGVVVRVELDSGVCSTVAEYDSPSEVLPDAYRSTAFRCGSIVGSTLTICTQTEVLSYCLPDFAIVRHLSLPLFNDLHHAFALDDGVLLIVNTGLDMVVEVTPDDQVRQAWSVVDAEPWQRFSRGLDYRKVPTTKPHRSHPNHVFKLEGEVWVTRFEQRDAISLTSQSPSIRIDLEAPHDGVPHGDAVFFTTVDGHVIEVDQGTLDTRRVYDLTRFRGDQGPRGWCRGLLRDGHATWVGYSRLRPTRFRKNVSWVKHRLDREPGTSPTSLVVYDLERGEQLAEIDLEPYGLNTIFSILAHPASR